MTNRHGNGRLNDWPEWAKAILHELRDLKREAAEDRKQAAEDRKQAAVDRKHWQSSMDRIEEGLAGLNESFHLLARVQVQMNDRLGEMMAHLGVISANTRESLELARAHQKELVATRKEHSALLREILRTLRVQGNGRSGNGSK